MARLNDEVEQKWSLKFHLIQGHERYPSRSTGAYSHRSKAFDVAIQTHQVTSLLIEDESGMLGYSVNRGTCEREGSQNLTGFILPFL